MVERNFFSHEIPGGVDVFGEMSRRGYCFELAGENIGWNTWTDDAATHEIHTMFLDSSGHRRNIVGASWDVIGIGAYKGPDGRKMWTVLFADACETVTSEASLRPLDPRPLIPIPAPTPASGGPDPTGQFAASRLDRVGPRPLAAALAAVARIAITSVAAIHRLLAIGTGPASAR